MWKEYLYLTDTTTKSYVPYVQDIYCDRVIGTNCLHFNNTLATL